MEKQSFFQMIFDENTNALVEIVGLNILVVDFLFFRHENLSFHVCICN